LTETKEPIKIILITNPKEKGVVDNQKGTTISQSEIKANQAPKIRQLSIPNFTIKSNSSEKNEKKYEVNKSKNSVFNFYNDLGKTKI